MWVLYGACYYKYTINWAKTKEILHELWLKLHEWLKKAGNEPSQALPRQLSQGESQAVNLDAKVLGTKRKLPAVLLPLPLGEVASRSDDGEGAHIPLYDRIMNLYKHFCKALDSTGKLAIMVLALRNKEC